MTGYALIFVLHGMPFFTICCFAIICLILIWLQEIAVAMSDPFGDDDIDFDATKQLSDAYDSALALLMDGREPFALQNPPAMPCPLTSFSRGGGGWSSAGAGDNDVFTTSAHESFMRSNLAKPNERPRPQLSKRSMFAAIPTPRGQRSHERAAGTFAPPEIGPRPEEREPLGPTRTNSSSTLPHASVLERAEFERAELAEVEMSFRDNAARCSKSFPVRDRVANRQGDSAAGECREKGGRLGFGNHGDAYGV